MFSCRERITAIVCRMLLKRGMTPDNFDTVGAVNAPISLTVKAA